MAVPSLSRALALAPGEPRVLAVPDSRLAEEHLRILTKVPHMAGTVEDKATADYVAQKFRDAGLDTEIVEYKAWMNYPAEISVDMVAPAGVEMHGPTREHVDDDANQDDPRVVMPFNGMSPSGDVEADVTKLVPMEKWRHAHHWLILHGRYVCKARRPECWRCVAAAWCHYGDKVAAPQMADA